MNALTDKERSALVRIPVEKWDAEGRLACEDDVAEEVPVALEYNGISHAVMMASPYDLEDFALGFSLSEGLLKDRSELYDCEVVHGCDGITVQMEIATERFVALKDKRRNLTGRTGCGLCGAETLEQAIRHPLAVRSTVHFTAAQIHAGMESMKAMQRLQRFTGATHAAAWMNAQGCIELVREDVGRHNALDKLIGAMATRRMDFFTGAALITSRASYEMVQKSATVGIGFVAAISGPTGLAVRLAQETDLTLIGFTRNGGHVVYANGQRLDHTETKTGNT
ncbi:MAG: formate dehydrogenase accessory sulfurtransferase FdhD [Burkholderiaceae bacterium]